jgi:hypothetical protein
MGLTGIYIWRICATRMGIIPVSRKADSSGLSADWYRAPGWPAAARQTKTHADPPLTHSSWVNLKAGWYKLCGLHRVGVTVA